MGRKTNRGVGFLYELKKTFCVVNLLGFSVSGAGFLYELKKKMFCFLLIFLVLVYPLLAGSGKL